MASEPIAVGSRKFNWADDDDDDFDLARWNATADTSAPSAAELGPLQVPPAGDTTGEENEAYTLSHIRNERACGDAPAPEKPPTTELAQVPGLTAQLPAEYWYLAVLNCRPEHQVMSARFDRITRAIGLRYDGKEDPDAPAYPELSSNKAYRSNYAKGFQSWKMKHRSLSCSKVYRCSPLNIVTSIENAHEIDDIDDIDVGADEEVEEVLDEYEAMQIFAFELHEQDQVFVSDHYERDEEADREMNEEIDRMLVELGRNNVDIADQFSRKELEGLYHEYKAQELEIVQVDTEQLYAKAGLDVIEEEDTASMDSFEASCGDEELFDSSHPCTTSNEKLFLTTNMTQDKKALSSLSIPLDTAATEEDLDFNNVVFEDEDKAQDSKSETHSQTDSEPVDEGYASSSPPITPTLESFTANGKRHTHNCFVPSEMRLSSSSMRRKTNGRTHSMDALQEFRQAAGNEQPVDHAFDEDEEYAVLEGIQEEENSDDQLEAPLRTGKSPEFTFSVEPPEEDEKISHCPLSSPAPILIEEANNSRSDEADYQDQPSIDEERGILNMSFAFPGPSADHTPSKSTSRRWTDPPKYIPDAPPVLPSPTHRHRKQNSLSLEHLASAVTKSKFYIYEMPWTQVGVMAAGVVAGGLLSMARRQ